MAEESARLKLILDGKEFTVSAEQAGRVLDTLKDKAKKTDQEVSGLKGLKKMFGEESGVGLVTKTLMGAGAIAAVSQVSQLMANIADQAEKFSVALARGEKTLADLPVEIARSLPVLRDVLSIADKIPNILAPMTPEATDQKIAQTELTAALKVQLDLAATRTEQEEKTLKIEQDRTALLEKAKAIYEARAAANPGEESSALRIRFQQEAMIEAIGPAQRAKDAAKAEADAVKSATEAEEARRESIANTVTALMDQARWYGKTAEQVKVLELAERGATAEQIEAAQAAIDYVEALKEKDREAEKAAAILKDAERSSEATAAAAIPAVESDIAAVYARIAQSAANPADAPTRKLVDNTGRTANKMDEAVVQLAAQTEAQRGMLDELRRGVTARFK